jgi:predicted RNase H-like HicB family nuclease
MKRVEDYLALDYPVLVTRDPETTAFVLEVPDWPGCVTHGATLEEAFEKLDDAKFTWVEDCLQRNIEIPQPRPRDSYSGRFLLRLPRSLHRRLVYVAEQEGISLNSYVSNVLSEHVGRVGGVSSLTSVREEIESLLGEIKGSVSNLSAPTVTAAPALIALHYLVQRRFLGATTSLISAKQSESWMTSCVGATAKEEDDNALLKGPLYQLR